jgi:hypothetical protein
MLPAALVVFTEDYSDPSPLNLVDLEARPGSRVVDAFATMGWRVESAEARTLTVRFVNGSDAHPGALPQLLGLERIIRDQDLSPVAIEQIPTVHVAMSNGSSGYLDVELAALASDLELAWASHALAEGTLIAVPLGEGFASGSASVIRTDDALVRTTYSDGGSFDGSTTETAERLAHLHEMSVELITVAGG